jgi:hypothetical protein
MSIRKAVGNIGGGLIKIRAKKLLGWQPVAAGVRGENHKCKILSIL